MANRRFSPISSLEDTILLYFTPTQNLSMLDFAIFMLRHINMIKHNPSKFECLTWRETYSIVQSEVGI